MTIKELKKLIINRNTSQEDNEKLISFMNEEFSSDKEVDLSKYDEDPNTYGVLFNFRLNFMNPFWVMYSTYLKVKEDEI